MGFKRILSRFDASGAKDLAQADDSRSIHEIGGARPREARGWRFAKICAIGDIGTDWLHIGLRP